MKILFGGLSASGKSYQARLIAEHYKLPLFSGSEYLLSLLNREDSSEEFVWLGEDSLELEKARNTTDIDYKVDDFLLNTAEKRFGVYDTWTLPWLYRNPDVIRVYLKGSLDERIAIASGTKSDIPTYYELASGISYKDLSSQERFKEMYGIDIFDVSNFDLVIHNAKIKKESTTSLIINYIDEFYANHLKLENDGLTNDLRKL